MQLITVFTPTYNRGYNLLNIYNSLLLQTYKNFEWIIVDDGSTDSTQEQIANFKKDNIISITYLWQKNKGKHFAINRGVHEAKGELFFILDSDDEIPEKCFEIVVSKYEEVKLNKQIGGIAGRGMYKDGKIVGNSNFSEIITNSLQIRYKYNVTGDLSEVFKTEVLREFPFPEIENEKFCPEALIWNRIAQKYNLFFFNIPIYIIEYMPDGLSSKIVRIRMKSPIASMATYSELLRYNIPFIQKIKASVNFWRFALCSKIVFSKKINMIPLYFTILTLPIGFLMFLNDKRKNNINEN